MQWYTHTLTGDSSIFNVGTVMNAKWVAGTVDNSGLIPSTGHLVQKNGSCSPTKVSSRPSNCICGDHFAAWVRTQTGFVAIYWRPSYINSSLDSSLSFYISKCVTNLCNQHAHAVWSWAPIAENPSCVHTTLASEVLQESSHTVPHALLLQISTRPSYWFVPPWSLMSPLVHGTVGKGKNRPFKRG